jgi:hypothetical protein
LNHALDSPQIGRSCPPNALRVSRRLEEACLIKRDGVFLRLDTKDTVLFVKGEFTACLPS